MPHPQPAIVAHRGLHAWHPENSLEAFAAAWDAGVAWCECDVHATADGVPVVLHDESLDRTTNGRGPVSRTTFAELRRVRLKRSDGSVGGVVPSLREVTAAMPAGCGVLVEIKPADEGLVRAVLAETAGRARVVQSFDSANLVTARRADPSVPLAFLVETEAALSDAARGEWPAVHVGRHLLDSPAISGLLRNGGRDRRLDGEHAGRRPPGALPRPPHDHHRRPGDGQASG